MAIQSTSDTMDISSFLRGRDLAAVAEPATSSPSDAEETSGAFDRFRSNASSLTSSAKSVVEGASQGSPGSILVILVLLMLFMNAGWTGSTLIVILAIALMFIL